MVAIRTPQEIFNIAYIGLAGQGFLQSSDGPSMEGGTCLYRGPNGLKCAIGHCIADEDYSEEFEALALSNAQLREAAGYTLENRGFVNWLQMCHDLASSPSDMQERLHKFAKDRDLTIPEVA